MTYVPLILLNCYSSARLTSLPLSSLLYALLAMSHVNCRSFYYYFIWIVQAYNVCTHRRTCTQISCCKTSLVPEHLKVYTTFVCVRVAQSYPTLGNPVDYSLPDSSVHRFFQARMPEWVAIPFSRGSSRPRKIELNPVLHIAGRFFTVWATR